MAGFDFNNLPAFFKTLFPPGLIKALSLNGSPFRARLATTDSFGGSAVKEVPMQYALPQARSRNAAIAINQRLSSSAKLAQWTVKAGYDYAVFSLKYADILRAREDAMAFGRLQQLAMTSTLASLNDSINRSLLSDGSGTIGQAKTSGTTALTTTTITNDTVTLQNIADAYLFEVGMNVQFYNTLGANSTPTLLGSGESHVVLAINPEAGTLQFDFNLSLVGGGGVVNSTFLIAQGDGVGFSSTTEDGAIVGVQTYLPIVAPVAGQTLWSQDRSLYTTKLAGHRADGRQRVLFEEVQRMVARIMRLKGKPDTCYMSPEQLQNMIIGRDNMTENFREVVRVSGDDGFGGMMYQDIGFSGVRIQTPNGPMECFGDPFFPADRVLVTQQNTWELQTQGEFPHMVEMGNVNGLQQDSDQYSVQGRFFAAGQLINTAPAYSGMIQVTPII